MGERYVNELAKNPTVERFMILSRQFTEHLDLVTPKLRKIFDMMDASGYTFTMAMFGEVAFSVMQKDKAVEAAKVFESYFPKRESVVVGINEDGAKITSRIS
jgi:pantoate kinase